MSGLPWIIGHQRKKLFIDSISWQAEKTHQIVWNSLSDYDRLEWQQILNDLEIALDF